MKIITFPVPLEGHPRTVNEYHPTEVQLLVAKKIHVRVFLEDGIKMDGIVNSYRDSSGGNLNAPRRVDAISIQQEDGGINWISAEYTMQYLDYDKRLLELHDAYRDTIAAKMVKEMVRIMPDAKKVYTEFVLEDMCGLLLDWLTKQEMPVDV